MVMKKLFASSALVPTVSVLSALSAVFLALAACGGSSHEGGTGGTSFSTGSHATNACSQLASCCGSETLTSSERQICVETVNAQNAASCQVTFNSFASSGQCSQSVGSTGIGSTGVGSTGIGSTGIGSTGGPTSSADVGTGSSVSTGTGSTTYPECTSYANKYCDCLGAAMAPDCKANIADNCNTYYDIETAFLACFLAAPDCKSAFQCKP